MMKKRNLSHKFSVVQKIINHVRDELIEGLVKSGDRLPSEKELASKFSVSRNAVREAMKMLKATGVVEIRQGRGTCIATNISSPVVDSLIFSLILDDGTPEKLLELREMLEIGVLEIVIKNATQRDIEKMEKAIKLMEKDDKRRERSRRIIENHDLAFHHAFVGATHNPLIAKIAKTVWKMFAPSIGKSSQFTLKETVEIHRDIIQGIKERNLEKTKAAIYKSLEDWKEDQKQAELKKRQ